MKISDLFSAVGAVKLAAAGIAGAMIGAAAVVVWVAAVTVPAARKDATRLAEASALAAFNNTMGEMTDGADKFEFAFDVCGRLGGVYDYATGKCAEK